MTEPANPYDFLPELPPLEVRSADFTDGAELPEAHRAAGVGGRDSSPQLSWSGAPADTRSYAVTCYDPDAPTASGFWHWAVYDIPALTTQLPSGAGAPGGAALPPGALTLPNELGTAEYTGAAPPAGHRRHRYFFAVHAVDVEELGLPERATPAVLGFTLFSHALARGLIVATYQQV